MRFWPIVLLAGCGSPNAIESAAPPVTQQHVSEGGNTTKTDPVPAESLKSCSVEMLDTFGGTSQGWRREEFDPKGRPRAKATSTPGLPVWRGEYGYDGMGRVVYATP